MHLKWKERQSESFEGESWEYPVIFHTAILPDKEVETSLSRFHVMLLYMQCIFYLYSHTEGFLILYYVASEK